MYLTSWCAGHFARVYLARVRSPSDPFILVLKCLRKDEIISKGVQKQVRREIEVCGSFRLYPGVGSRSADHAAIPVGITPLCQASPPPDGEADIQTSSGCTAGSTTRIGSSSCWNLQVRLAL